MVQTRSDSKVRTVASSHLPMRHVRRLNEGRRRDGLSGLGSAPGSRKSIHVKRTSFVRFGPTAGGYLPGDPIDPF
jgi:hypothetical protein